ncbi:MAG: hypothetical protein ABF449_02410 [Ethanoligenens sp.]
MIGDILRYVAQNCIALVFGILSGIIGYATKTTRARQKALAEQQSKLKSEQSNIRDGLLALLHDRIYSGYAACESQGYATVEDLRNIEYLYKPYHALGGNGTGTELFERVKSMPPAYTGKEKML